MNKVFKKENLKPLLVLGIICILVAVILAAINMVTGPIIKKMEEQKVYDSLREALDGEFEPAEIPSGTPSNVTGLYKVTDGDNLVGHVVTVEKQGYASKIVLTVGIKADGTVNRVVVTAQQESHGKDINPLINGFSGVSAEGVGDVEHVSGATITSKTIKEAVADAFKALSPDADNGGEEEEPETEALPKTDEEIIALAKELVGEECELTDVTPEETTNVKRVYRVSGNKGYIVYTYTINERYGNIDTENLVYIGTNGAIKNIKKLTWSVSEAAPDWGYIPPTDEEMNQFYEGLNGKDKNTIGDVELSTGATNTTTVLVDTLKEALDVVGEIIKNDFPTPEAEIIALAKELVGDGSEFTDVTPDERTFVKRIYRENSGKGYVAYLVVINERYARIETETLVYVENSGKINNTKKLIWKTSDAGWGYEPPEDSLVDAFYESLKGKKLSDLEALLALENNDDGMLVTNATSTSKALLGALVEGVSAIDELIAKDMPTGEEQLFEIAKGMIGADAEFTDITPDSISFVKKIYRENKGRGYLAYLVVINERYARIETETLIYVGNDGKIKDIEKIIWKTSDAGWGYEPPAENLVDAFYDSLNGKGLTELEALLALESNEDGMLVTNATSTSKALLGALVEGVSAIDDARKKDMPRAEDDVLDFAQQMAGKGATLTNVTPGDVQFLKRLYRIDETNNYIAYVVVINERYGRVETETLIYIADNGVLKDINKLTWKTSDAGWGYEPPEESVVDVFYAGLKGKTISELKELLALESNEDGMLVTNATTTSKALLGALIEAFDSAESVDKDIDEPVNNTPKIVGIFALAVLVVAVAAYIALPIIKKRRKNG